MNTYIPMVMSILFCLSFMQNSNADNIIRIPAPVSLSKITQPTVEVPSLPDGSTLPDDQDPSKETWSTTVPSYTEWVNLGEPYNCSSWSPAPSRSTIIFDQIQSCSQDRVRERQDQEINSVTNQLRPVGDPVEEYLTETGDVGPQRILDCKYVRTPSSATFYYWRETSAGKGDIVWAGTFRLANGTIPTSKEVTISGVKYVRGVYMNSTTSYNNYSACKATQK